MEEIVVIPWKAFMENTWRPAPQPLTTKDIIQIAATAAWCALLIFGVHEAVERDIIPDISEVHVPLEPIRP